jgi:hypothetical protein
MAKVQKTNRKNIKAFHSVMKEYLRRKEKTLLPPLDLSIPKGKVDKVKPNDSDFFADVELVWEKSIEDNDLYVKFLVTYFDVTDTLSGLATGEQRTLENKIGREYIKRGIYPVIKYFETEK